MHARTLRRLTVWVAAALLITILSAELLHPLIEADTHTNSRFGYNHLTMEKPLIDGVQLKPLIAHADERGYLMELLRCDDPLFQKFGQAYVSLNYPGVIRAWHWHERQTDFWVVVKGMVKAALYDRRPDSPTFGMINEFFLGEHHRVLLVIPAQVAHGYKTIGVEPSLLINFPTEPYNRAQPDELRLPYDTPEIPYDWGIRMG